MHNVAWPLRAAQSLLAYLALTAGTAHRREQLAGLLWPDADEATAKGNLRHTLWRMRKALGAYDCLRADDFTPNAVVAFTVYASQGSSEVVLEISRQADDAGHVFIDGWEHSAEHKHNLLLPDAEAAGVAVSYRNGRAYYTLVLGAE